MVFANKKNSLPPRPSMPSQKYMLEDLDKAAVDDVAFKIINELNLKESHSVNDSDDTYRKMKSYLNTKQQLKQLQSTLKKEIQQMNEDNEEIKRLADDIRKQAEAALMIH